MAMSFVLADEHTAESQEALRRIAAEGAVVPAHWDFEVANALFTAERRGRLAEADLVHALQALRALPVSPQTSRPDSQRIIGLARQFALSIYDAAYLDLAIELNMPLATLDTPLRQAAVRAGVQRVPPPD